MLSKQSKCIYKVALVYCSADFVARDVFFTLSGIKFNPRIYGLQHKLITCEFDSFAALLLTAKAMRKKGQLPATSVPVFTRDHMATLTGTTMEPWPVNQRSPMIFEWILQIKGSAIYGPQIPSFNSVV